MNDIVLALLVFLVAVAFIVWGTAYRNLNPFFVLLLAAFGTGLLAGLPPTQLIEAVKTGFGDTMSKIGILILLGTVLGVLMEKTGATISLANFILNKVGRKNAPLANSLTGFTVGLPIFCDSGFIILSGLNKALTRSAQFAMPLMATALATGLYAVHCLVPPHPGISAASGTIGADIGQVMLWGILLAIPAAAAGHFWAKKTSAQYVDKEEFSNELTLEKQVETGFSTHSPALAALPVILPISLIGLKTVLLFDADPETLSRSFGAQFLSFIGEPLVALLLSIAAVLLFLKQKNARANEWLTEGIAKAGLVLAITAAGGAFGNILKVTNIGGVLGNALATLHLGIWLPFLLAMLLKIAQGSSTVAVIAAASLVSPMLSQLGFESEWDKVAVTLAMGAGSMAISHGNDSYFWVVARFSEIEPKVMYRVYSTATLVMALTAQSLIWVVTMIL